MNARTDAALNFEQGAAWDNPMGTDGFEFIEYAAPEGPVRLDGTNQHTWKTVRIGMVRKDGLIDEVWSSGKPVQPDPYLTAYPWAKELAAK